MEHLGTLKCGHGGFQDPGGGVFFGILVGHDMNMLRIFELTFQDTIRWDMFFSWFFLCNVKTYGWEKPSGKGVVPSNIGNFMEVAVVNCTRSQPLHSLSRFSSTYLHPTLGVNIPCHRTEGWSVESEPQPKFVGYMPILHPPLFDEHLLARRG